MLIGVLAEELLVPIGNPGGALSEAANATDNSISVIVISMLVDDPASGSEQVDAYLGEIMLEAASAADALDYAGVQTASIDEAATAADTNDATVTSFATVTWDASTVAAVTLSGGDLAATNTGTTSANQGAHVVATSGKSTGKYYIEFTWTTILGGGTGGGNFGVGVGTTASTYTNMGNGGTTGIHHYRGGSTWSNGSQVLTGVGGWVQGQVVGVAVDLDNRRFWFRLSPSGNWNNSGTANPATNTGGLTIPAGTMVPFVTFGGASGVANNVLTANFGASAFSGTAPSGFTSGWPI